MELIGRMRTVYLSWFAALVAILIVSLTLVVMVFYLDIEQIQEQIGLSFFTIIIFVQILIVAIVLSILLRRRY